MAQRKDEWEELGRRVQDIVDRAVSSHDYQKLNQTIRQTVERAVDLGGEAVKKAVGEKNRRTAPKAPREVVEPKKLPVLYGSTNGKTAGGVLKIVFGSLGILGSFVAEVIALLAMLVPGTDGSAALTALAALGGSVWLLVSGIGNLNYISRFKTYCKALGKKTHCTLENLARRVRKNEKFVRREVQKMIDQGLFLEGHLDKEGATLITSNETFRYFERSRLQLEERQRLEAEAREKARQETASRPPQVQEVLDRGDAYIEEIRRCNDRIPGQEISAKISRMERIVERIFDRAETHPEVIPDLKKMMDYYLPMTVKLLDAYADMDAQPVQGETIRNSKREIEQTLDTLNLAFEKLLDDLFEDTAMDISSDISVLNTLLAQEGLTEDELTKMKKTL